MWVRSDPQRASGRPLSCEAHPASPGRLNVAETNVLSVGDVVFNTFPFYRLVGNRDWGGGTCCALQRPRSER